MDRRFVALAALVSAPLLLAQAPAPATPDPCAGPEFHQFDFWAGAWDVYGPKGKQVANSLIEKVYGCGIRENWIPFQGGGGGSLNIYVPSAKHWEQFWIDSGGTRALFVGGMKGKAMVIEGEWDGPLVRITYTPNADGSVRQYGEQSTDGGKQWAPSFDLIYRPHPAGTAFPTPRPEPRSATFPC
jgi:hypothetical protein